MTTEEKQDPQRCPSCQSHMRMVQIPCPDGIVDCMVLHQRYECTGCPYVSGARPERHKPPLGVLPVDIWHTRVIEDRIQNLARAIAAYVKEKPSGEYKIEIAVWCEELASIIRKKLEERG